MSYTFYFNKIELLVQKLHIIRNVSWFRQFKNKLSSNSFMQLQGESNSGKSKPKYLCIHIFKVNFDGKILLWTE